MNAGWGKPVGVTVISTVREKQNILIGAKMDPKYNE